MWNADTASQAQAFQDNTLEGLSKAIAYYYAEDDDTICQIEDVYFEDDHGARSTLSDYGLERFCGTCEMLNQHFRSEADAEAEAMRQNTSDYFSNIL
jgi:hypothetical protein